MTATAKLLADVEALIRRFIALRDDHQAATVALFVAHTHVFDAAETTPYLAVLSAEKRSGKSRLLELLARLCRRAEHTSGASEAALFQTIQQSRPTLLLDEVDAVFAQSAERTEALRGAINSGNRKAGSVLRGGKDGQALRYSTFCPKVLAGIENGKLPDTIRDRSIPILMRRKPPGIEVERLLWRDVGADVQGVHDRLLAWASEHEDELARARPNLPAQLDDRSAEGWEPLLAIADLAGAGWPQRAREAAVILAGDFDDEEQSRGVRLLADLRAVLVTESMATADLLAALNGIDEAPWSAWSDGNGINARNLARLLRPYEVKPRNVRTASGQAKGYSRDDLLDAWSRYLPTAEGMSETSVPDVPSVPAGGSGTDGTLGTDKSECVQATPEEEALAAMAFEFLADSEDSGVAR